MFIMLSSTTYEHWIQTGDVIIQNTPASSAYVRQHPHLFQSPISAINYCIVEHALMRVTGHQLEHPSNLLLHLKLSPAPLIKQEVLITFNRPSRERQELENMVRHLQGLASYSIMASTFQGTSSAAINDIVAQDFFAEHHLLDYSCISGPGYLTSIASAVNLLNHPDISIKAERLIRNFRPTSIYLIKSTERSASSSEERQSSRKSHRAASSMSTSFNKDGSIHINVKYC